MALHCWEKLRKLRYTRDEELHLFLCELPRSPAL